VLTKLALVALALAASSVSGADGDVLAHIGPFCGLRSAFAGERIAFAGPSRVAFAARRPAAAGAPLPVPPVVEAKNGVARLSMSAEFDPFANLPELWFGNGPTPPTIRLHPGDTLEIRYTNDLQAPIGIGGQTGPNATNLHFHGLRVSPQPGSDDVLTMLAPPGATLLYRLKLPADAEPGLYWYHTHPHGETAKQVGDGGMSGLIVVEGLQQHLPVLAGMRERDLIMRRTPLIGQAHPDARAARAARRAAFAAGAKPPACNGTDKGYQLLLNGALQPKIAIQPGEPELFRIANASSLRNLDLSIDGEPLILVALDGVALDRFAGSPAIQIRQHVIIPPAGRAEFVAIGQDAPTVMRANCFYSGPTGDPDPPQILATLASDANSAAGRRGFPSVGRILASRVVPLPDAVLAHALPAPSVQRVTVFSEDADGTAFFIDGKQFSHDDPPHFIARAGTVEEWTVLNDSDEVHDFHIHQVHFIVTAVNGRPTGVPPSWYDSYNIPPRTHNPDGSVTPGWLTLLIDFRDPVIRGEFVYHCHILDHEDLGMMAKISVQ
jgi:FtsP/CotA-like multicopper oxidase with cupredoxin domain